MLIVKKEGRLLLAVIHNSVGSVTSGCALSEPHRVAKFGAVISQPFHGSGLNGPGNGGHNRGKKENCVLSHIFLQ